MFSFNPGNEFTTEEARGIIWTGIGYANDQSDSERESDIDLIEIEDEEPEDSSTIATSDNNWHRVDEFDGGPQYQPFTPNGQCGPRNIEHLDGASPGEFFKLFFSEELVNHITNETNKYASEKISVAGFSPQSRLNKWEVTSVSEVYSVIGLLLNMGIVRLPSIHMYWSKRKNSNIPFFAEVMSRNRFQLIFHTMLQCCTTDKKNHIRGDKIDPIIQKLVAKYQEHFCPFHNVSADETMIGYKGRIAFKRYMPNKPVKWGMLARTIADASTGYIFNIKMDYGGQLVGELPEGVTKTSNYVLQLMENHMECGYHVFVDRLYNSVSLAKALHERKTALTGTVMTNRKGLPDGLKSKLKKGEKVSYRNGQILAMTWHDKRPISMLSTHCVGHTYVEKQIRGSTETIQKPSCIDEYNKHMGGVDLADQYSTYYNFARKSIKWWKKIFFWLVETSLTNSFIIYKMSRPEARNITLLQYRQIVVNDLTNRTEITCSPAKYKMKLPVDLSIKKRRISYDRLDDRFHCQEKIAKQRRCKVCYASGKRRETVYICGTCDQSPALHPGTCFTVFHTKENYKCQE